MWSEYFCKESKIYGLDNLHDKNVHSVPINEEWTSAKNVEYIIGDAYTEEVSNKIGKIDILIDDGPHTFESHIKLLELYIPKMNVGGVIVMEDISYDPNITMVATAANEYEFTGGKTRTHSKPFHRKRSPKESINS